MEVMTGKYSGLMCPGSNTKSTTLPGSVIKMPTLIPVRSVVLSQYYSCTEIGEKQIF